MPYMENIEFTAWYGDKQKKIVLSEPHGAIGQFFVEIEGYYQGALMKLQGEWVWHHNKPDDFTTDDIQILGEMIDNEKRDYLS